MPDDLDAIDWPALNHAYGPAGNLPGLIRRAAASDARARGEAIHELWGTVWHQGTVYEATAPAVAFLAHIASNRHVSDQDRWQLIWMLGEIALGTPVTNADLSFVEASHVAVARVSPALLRELPADGLVRWALVGLAASVPKAATDAREPVRRLLTTTANPRLRAAVRLTLDTISGQAASDVAVLAVLAAFPNVGEAAPRPDAPFASRWPSVVVRSLIEDAHGLL